MGSYTSEAFGVQIEAPSGISGMRRAFLDAVEAGKNVQLNIDNAENSGYTEENGGVSNDGNRMVGGMAEGVPERQDTRGKREETWRDGRTNQVLSRRNLSQSVQNAFTESGVVAAELYDFDADNAAFSSALDAARAADADHGWAVTPKSSAELQGKRTFMDEGGTIGFALTDDGDIEAVFKNKQLNKTPHAMDGVIPQAIADGGKKLDCYGEKLVSIYEDYGFVPVARVEFNEEHANPGWDKRKGTPYVYFMMHNGDSAETVVSNIGKYGHMTQEQLESLPTYGKDGYDQATAYRDSLLNGRNSALASVNNDGGDSGGDGNGTESNSPSNDHEKRESKFVENTLKNSPVFGGVFQDVRDEMLEQNKNAAQYNISHEIDSMAEAADRIQADPKGEAEYLLTDNDGHVWSAPDIDTAMGLIASNQLDGNEARAVELALAVKEAGTQAGQTVQALAKWSRTPHGAAVDAVSEMNDGRFSRERVIELGDKLMNYASRVQQAADAFRNEETGKIEGFGSREMIDVISGLAEMRGTTGIFSKKLGNRMLYMLSKLPNETFERIAVSQIRGVPSDMTHTKSKAEVAGALFLPVPERFSCNTDF